jgi:hypothetical protein
MAPAKWYYSNKSLEFLHHHAQKLVHQTLKRVSVMPKRELTAELRAVQGRYAATRALLASPLAAAGTKVVHVRTRSGKQPVAGTEALYLARKGLVYYRDDFWTPQQYLQLLECGSHDPRGRLWCFATETQPLANLRGETM